jgi:hypothetical protein
MQGGCPQNHRPLPRTLALGMGRAQIYRQETNPIGAQGIPVPSQKTNVRVYLSEMNAFYLWRAGGLRNCR